jgi:hypothetical protein
MTYIDAKDLALTYSGIIGKPMLNKLVFIDDRKITSLLVSSREHITEVFSAWWQNGNDNEKAITRSRNAKNFEVFVMSYNPSVEKIIYYLRLTKYIELGEYFPKH